MDPAHFALERKKLLSLILKSCNMFNVKNMVCETPHGTFMVDVKDSDVGRLLLETGEYGYQEMLQWFKHLTIDDNTKMLIDIGANIGTTSIPIAIDKRFSKIISFEPDPYNFSLLEFNIKRNGLCDIIIPQNIAIGDSTGNVTFELSPLNLGDHRVRYCEPTTGLYNEQERKTIEVPITTLDSVFEQQNIDINQVSLIKSDTQGNEGRVLRGAQNILSKKKVPWIIEFWPYGLARSQIQKEEFLQMVGDSFSAFIELGSSGSLLKDEISKLYQLYERYTKDTWCNLMLLP